MKISRKRQLMKIINETRQILAEEEQQVEYQTLKDRIRGFAMALKAGAEETRSFLDNEGKGQAFRQWLMSGLEDGDKNDDQIKITMEPQKLVDLQPSQGFIDAGQSVAFTYSNYKFGFKPSMSGGPYTAKDPLSVAGNVILDGHHRWSGGLAVNPDAQINTRNFQVSGDPGEKLAKMQAAVATKTPANQSLPSKGGDAAKDILGASSDAIREILAKMCGVNVTQFDPGAPNEIFMGEKFLQDLTADTGNRGQLQALFGITEEDLNNRVKEEKKYPDFASIDCPVRKKLVQGSANNLAKMKPQAPGTPSQREDMPQLDHKDIGGKEGFKKIRQDLAKGRINIESPWGEQAEATWHKGEALNESRARWQKLAGILKD